MEMCRACLTTENGMVRMDENFRHDYNTLTSLNLSLAEDMPLYTCKVCFDGAKFCIEFRKKCIESDQYFKETLRTEIQEEKYILKEYRNENITIKKEVKLEYDDESDDSYADLSKKFDDNDDEVYLVELSPKIKMKKTKNNKPLLKLKIKEEKLIDSKLYCSICPESFKDEKGLTKHLDNHKLSEPCVQCGECFVNLPHLLGHRIEHLPDRKKRCHICSKKFLTAASLEFHYMRIHELAEKDLPIQCKKCLASFESGKRLHRHNENYHSEIKFKCEHCDLGFGRKIQLKIHMRKHEQIKRYECDLCDYTSKYPGGVRAHKLRKHTEGRVYCKTCTCAFSSQARLDKHDCKDAFGIICPVCGISITRKCGSALSRHMMTHDEVFRYKCDKCPAKFKSRGSYKTHMDKHAGTPKHQCEHCLRCFYSPTVLIKHRRTHTGEKPYVCTVCNRGFTGKHNLKVHMKVHGITNLINKKDAE